MGMFSKNYEIVPVKYIKLYTICVRVLAPVVIIAGKPTPTGLCIACGSGPAPDEASPDDIESGSAQSIGQPLPILASL